MNTFYMFEPKHFLQEAYTNSLCMVMIIFELRNKSINYKMLGVACF